MMARDAGMLRALIMTAAVSVGGFAIADSPTLKPRYTEEGDKKSLLIYESYCDESIAEECGRFEFACQGGHGGPSEYSMLSVEPHQFVAMLAGAGSSLESALEKETSESQVIGLPKGTLKVGSQRRLNEFYIGQVSASYDYQFGFWKVTASPGTESAQYVELLSSLLRTSEVLVFELFGRREELPLNTEVREALTRLVDACKR
jgi:hypothetical protein